MSEAQPILLSRSIDIQGSGNFTRGCSFSPDGLCILTCTASDNLFRLYNTPCTSSYEAIIDGVGMKSPCLTPCKRSLEDTVGKECDKPSAPNNGHGTETPTILPWNSALTAKEGDSVRDYAWYPLMNSCDPSSCIFLSSSREQPMHLIDAYDGSIRCSYRAYDDVDAIEAASSVTFSPDGQRIVAGFNRCVKVFHTAIPGKDCDVWNLGKSKRSKDGQKGIVSSVSFPPISGSVFAVGTYSGSIYLYDDRAPSGGLSSSVLNHGVCIVGQGKNFSKKRRFNDETGEGDSGLFSAAKVKWFQKAAKGGITQLKFSHDGHVLYSASRRSNSVISWDLRMLSDPGAGSVRGLASYQRDGMTNQRLGFDLNQFGDRLFLASRDQTVKIYDVKANKMVACIEGLGDVANGVSYMERERLLAVSIGARRFQEHDYYDENTDQEEDGSATVTTTPSGTLELYKI